MKTGTIEVHEAGKRLVLLGSFIPASAAELEHLRATIEEHKLVAVAEPPKIVDGELQLHVEFLPQADVVKMFAAPAGEKATNQVPPPKGKAPDQGQLGKAKGSAKVTKTKPGTGAPTVENQGDLPSGAQSEVLTEPAQ